MSHESDSPSEKENEKSPSSSFPILSYRYGQRPRLSYPDIRPPLTLQQIETLNFESLYEMGKIAVEPVPKDERAKYRYWRGASLAKIAINLARGHTTLNAGSDLVAHVTDSYAYALSAATDGARLTQLTGRDRAELSELTGHPLGSPLPGIVIALNEVFNTLELSASEYGSQHGFVLQRPLTMEMLDPYSQTAIEDLLIH